MLQDLVQPQLSYKDRKIAQQQQRDQVVRLTNAEVRRCPLSEASMLGLGVALVAGILQASSCQRPSRDLRRQPSACTT